MENVIQHKKIFQSIFRFSSEGILICSETGIITAANPAIDKMFGYNSGKLIGRKLEIIFSQKSIEKLKLLLKNDINNVSMVQDQALLGLKKDGSQIFVKLKVRVSKHCNNQIFTIFIANITNHKKEEFLKKHLRKILKLITQHQSLDIIVKRITETLELYILDCKSSILKLDQEVGTLYNLSSPKLSYDFQQVLEGITIIPEICSCSCAAHEKKEILVSDITKEPLWKNHKALLSENNVNTAWSFPILSSTQEVLGTLTLYSHKNRKLTEFEKEVIEDLNLLAGMAIEQNNIHITLLQNQKELKGYNQRLKEEVKEHTDELMTTVQKLVETNINLEDQIQVTKAAETIAQENQVMFSAIAENFPNGIIVVVNNTFRVEYIEGQELDKLALRDLIHRGILIDNIHAFSEARKTRIKKDLQKTFDGEHLAFETEYKNNTYAVNTTPLFSNNVNNKQALLVYYNISQRKLAEQKILQTLEKEQKLNELKSRFISLASHEFRTPLSAILSSTNLIKKLNATRKVQKREKYLFKIKSNVKNLVSVLNDFLSLSKLEEGKLSLQSKYFDLIQFSKSLIEEMEPNKKEGQTIKIINKTPFIEVYLDSKLLRHVLSNLLSNAIKYSPVNAKITISITQEEKWISVQIKDHGIGIPVEEQKDIFQRFFRAKNAINIQGTGLGLYIVKQYIELMDGTISFKSNPKEGTTFFIKLPLKPKQNEKNLID